MKKFLFPIIIIILSFLNIGQSLNFAINGDDWLALYRYNLDFTSFQSHFDIRNYSTATTNYAFGYVMMGLISKLFSYNPFPYYLVALILRIITVFSFYLCVYSATKNKWMGYISAIFFSCMYAGIETTNWVSNMNTYLSIILLNIFIKLFYDQKSIMISFKTFLQSFILVASFLIAPVRMHGLLFFIPLVTFTKFEKLNKNNLVKFLVILFLMFIPVILARILTYPNSTSDYLKVIFSKNGEIFAVMFNLVANIGISILPNILIPPGNFVTSFEALVGGLVIVVLGVYFFYIRAIYPLYARFGLLSLASCIGFLIIPGFINPTSVFTSDHRYLIIPASWMMVTFSIIVVIFSSQKNNFLKYLSLLLTLLLVSINSFALQKYFSILSKEGRLSKDVDRIFTTINSKIVYKNSNAPLVFLFLSNDEFFIYNAVSFGFTPHMMVLNPTFAKDPQKAPFVVDNLDSLKSILADENSPELYRYGYKPVKIPIENVYSFYIDSEKVLDYTDQIRKIL